MMQQNKYHKINSLLTFITTYFTQILFLPLLLGGIIQLLNLYSISPQAVRFFSASQAIADGLLILSVGVLSLIGYVILITIMILYGAGVHDPKRQTVAQWEEENGERYAHLTERTPRAGHFLIMVCSIFCLYILFRYLPEQLLVRELGIGEFLFMATIALLFNLVIAINIASFIFWKEKYFVQDNRKFINVIYALITLILLIIYIQLSSQKNTFENFRVIEQKYCCEGKGRVKIIYYNDKFLFVKRNCDGDTQIFIEKFDTLFETIK